MFGTTLTWLHVSDYLNFWNTEDRSLVINILASYNSFSYRNVFQNGVSALSKMVLKSPFFCLFICFFFLGLKAQNVV